MRPSLALLIVLGYLLMAGRTPTSAGAQPAPPSPFRAGEARSPVLNLDFAASRGSEAAGPAPCHPEDAEAIAVRPPFERVGEMTGEEIVFTLRVRPEVTLGPPPACLPGLILLDDIHLLLLADGETP